MVIPENELVKIFVMKNMLVQVFTIKTCWQNLLLNVFINENISILFTVTRIKKMLICTYNAELYLYHTNFASTYFLFKQMFQYLKYTWLFTLTVQYKVIWHVVFFNKLNTLSKKCHLSDQKANLCLLILTGTEKKQKPEKTKIAKRDHRQEN